MKRIALLLIAWMVCLGANLAQAAEAAQQPAKPDIFVQLGHANIVNSVAFSPDGRYALSGSGDSTLKLWDVATGREIRTFTGHSGTGFVYSVAFSPDGKYALSGSYDRTIKLWDIATGRAVRTFKGHSGPVYSVAFSPDGRYALSGSADGTMKLWDISTGRVLHTFSGVSGSVAFSPDGHYALARGDHVLKLWDIATGKVVRTFSGEASHFAFSPDGKYILSNDSNNALKLWDNATGQIMRTFEGTGDDVKSVAISPDGRYAMSGSLNGLKLWDIATGKTIRTFTESWVSSAAFSPDGHYALSAGSGNALELWDVATGRDIRSFTGHSSPVNSVAISPDGKSILAVSGGTLKLWGISTGRMVRSFDGNGTVAFSPDGHYILAGDAVSADRRRWVTQLWDVATGRKVRSFKVHSVDVKSVAFSLDGHYLLTGGLTVSDDGHKPTLELWDVATGREIRNFKILSTHRDMVAVAFSPDERSVLSSDGSGVKLWDIATGKTIRTFAESAGMMSIAVSPDGRYVLGGHGYGLLKLWNITTGRVIRTFTGHSDVVTSLAFSPDGKYGLSGSWDRTLKLWDIATGRCIRTFKGHSTRVTSVAFSPDGKQVISGSNDSTTRIWDAATGRELVQFISFEDGGWIAVTPEGFFNASSPKAAAYLNVRIGNRVYGIDQLYDQLYRPDLVELALKGDPDGEVAMAAKRVDFSGILAAGAPPLVSFVSPAPGPSSQRDVEVVANLTGQKGGIGKVEWRLNGMTVGVAEPGRGIAIEGKPGVAPAGSIQLQHLLTLAPGENTIEVVAYSKAGIASNPAVLKLNLKDAVSEKPALYILAVGINKYRDKSLWLNYAVPDAESLVKGLTQSAGSIFTAVHVTGVYDQQATFDGIHSAFEQVAKQAKSNDVFILYLAGHGITLDGRYHFLPVDFRYNNEDSIRKSAIDQDDLQRWMADISARKNLVLLDTCNSGSFVEAQAVTRGLAEKTAIDKLIRATGRAMISASSESQAALEGYKGHGIFTYALLQALKQADSKDGNKDGVTSTGEIANFVEDFVPDVTYRKWGYEQNPQVNLHGQSFPVAVVAK